MFVVMSMIQQKVTRKAVYRPEHRLKTFQKAGSALCVVSVRRILVPLRNNADINKLKRRCSKIYITTPPL